MTLAPIDSTTLDPWRDLYMPAWLGDTDELRTGLRRVPSLPASSVGDGWAIAARALAVLGEHTEAERRFRLAVARGGPEVDALRALRERDEAWILARHQTAPTAGERGDAACDLAAMMMERGDVLSARQAIREARRACLDHLEAARWMRFLTDCPAPAAVWREPGSARPWAGDVEALRPCRANGWIGEERLRRRKSAEVQAPPEGTAGRRLWNAGAMGYWFALPDEYDRLDAAHPLIGLELRAETLLARVGEGRKTLPLAEALWRRVAGDEVDRRDAAQVIVSLATMDRTLCPLAVEVTDWLIEREPKERLWHGYRAWHALCAGRTDFLDHAWTAIAADSDCPLSWYLGVCTFAHAGMEARARGLAQGRLHDPVLGHHAAEILVGPDVPAPITMVTPRMRPKLMGAPADA